MKEDRKKLEAQIEREDMVMFINACFACTGQGEFYGESSDQALSVEFLHEYILVNYRKLYARTLASGINHFNQAFVIANLLATGRNTPEETRKEEGELIGRALQLLPPQRVWRLFTILRNRRVNNRRTRAVIRKYFAGKRNIIFDTVKYRNRIRIAAAHAHLPLETEQGRFLFNKMGKTKRFKTELYEIYRQAQYSQEAVYKLPYSVAEGFASDHGIPRDTFLERIEDKMTIMEKLRLQKSGEKSEVALDVNLEKTGLTRLALYILSLSFSERLQKKEKLEKALNRAALHTARRAPHKLGKVAAVLDRSYSSSGSGEKRRRPLAVALAAGYLLRHLAEEYLELWTPGLDRDILAAPLGQTDIATPLISALEWGAELVLIISDGYENDPSGAASEVVRVYRNKIDQSRKTSIIHMNPVFDATHYQPKTIGSSVPTVGLRDAEDILIMLGFARFADGTAPPDELERYLAFRVEEFLTERAS